MRKFLDKHVPTAEEMAAEGELAEAEELLAGGDSEAAIDRLAPRRDHRTTLGTKQDAVARSDIVDGLVDLGL